MVNVRRFRPKVRYAVFVNSETPVVESVAGCVGRGSRSGRLGAGLRSGTLGIVLEVAGKKTQS